MGIRTAIREAGRVLSKANQDKLQQATTHMQTAQGHVQDVIKSVGDPTETDDDVVTEAVRSQGQVQQLIADALRSSNAWDGWGPWIIDCYDDYVIVSDDGDFFSIPYAIQSDGTVTLGQSTPVIVTYTPADDATGDGDDDGDDGVLAPPGVPTSESTRLSVHAPLREADDDEEPTQTVSGKKFPASDFAFVPNAHKPSTWKLRLTAEPGGDPDPGIVGAAAAALSSGGFRGKKVEIPEGDLADVKAKVRTAWTKANPDKDKDEMPESIKESAVRMTATIIGDLVPLVETAVRSDGTAQLKIIEPGWGSTGYYPPDVLERDGPKAFPRGTHMYLDHPTISESRDRPERSLKDLAATLMEDAHWVDRGPDGPGLYATAQVREDYRDLLNAVAPHTGVSIHAAGAVETGDIDGRRGPIIQHIAEATEAQNSVDFVTRPGAGGHMLELFEAARHVPQKGPSAMTAETTQLAEAQALRIARLEEQLILSDAQRFIEAGLRTANLPDMTKTRISEALAKNPPAKDGLLDRDALAARLDEAVTAETKYLVEVAGYGRVAGVGSTMPTETDPAKLQESLAAEFAAFGLSEKAAVIAARGH